VADAVAERIEGMEEGIEFRVEVRLDTALTLDTGSLDLPTGRPAQCLSAPL
jgi:hypothetical protein